MHPTINSRSSPRSSWRPHPTTTRQHRARGDSRRAQSLFWLCVVVGAAFVGCGIGVAIGWTQRPPTECVAVASGVSGGLASNARDPEVLVLTHLGAPWCGLGGSEDPPINNLDACCQAHDLCGRGQLSGTTGWRQGAMPQLNCACDEAFFACLDTSDYVPRTSDPRDVTPSTLQALYKDQMSCWFPCASSGWCRHVWSSGSVRGGVDGRVDASTPPGSTRGGGTDALDGGALDPPPRVDPGGVASANATPPRTRAVDATVDGSANAAPSGDGRVAASANAAPSGDLLNQAWHWLRARTQ